MRPDSAIRLATWNLWWRFGDWRKRHAAIADTLERLQADVLGLQETWSSGPEDQVEKLARDLGYTYSHHPAPTASHWQRRLPGGEEVEVGNAVLSRWPITDVRTAVLSDPGATDGRTALLTRIDTPQGPLDFCCTQWSSAVPGSAIRTLQARRLAQWLATAPGDPAAQQVIVGDLNADPDADEIRRLGGHQTAPFVPGQVWVDAWRYRGDGDPGFTWRRDNPHVEATGEPWARVDYILLAPSSRGLPRVHRVELFATEATNGVYASDHAGVVADLALPRGP